MKTPTAADGGKTTLRGKDARRILADEFGKPLALSTAYKLLHDAGLACLRPRPKHRKNDPEKMAARLGRAPPPFCPRREGGPPGRRRVSVWFQDEVRAGQQGTLSTVWDDTGSRPTRVKQTEYQWVYLFAAVDPLTGRNSAMLAPHADTHYMNEHLRFIGEAAAAGEHVVLVLDGAGWHTSKALRVPANVTLLHLPPYSPELNPAERPWRTLRQDYLSNRAFADYDELFDEVKAAWNRLTAGAADVDHRHGLVAHGLDGNRIRQRSADRCRLAVNGAMAAVEAAADGRWIADGEWQVGDAFQRLTADCFGRLIQDRADRLPSATRAAFPSSKRGRACAAVQGAAVRAGADGRRCGDVRPAVILARQGGGRRRWRHGRVPGRRGGRD